MNHTADSFVILETDPFLGLDLEEMLSAEFPESAVSRGQGAADLVRYLSTSGENPTVVASGRLVSEDDGLKRLLVSAEQSGSKIVIYGRDNIMGDHAVHIQVPFKPDTLLGALADVDT